MLDAHNEYIENLIKKYPDLESCRLDILTTFQTLVSSYRNFGKVLVCGNGGSSADSEHIVGELMKGFMKKRPVSNETREKLAELYKEDSEFLADNLQGALPAISLSSHTALATAFSNDVHADMVFAQQVFGYGREGDILIGISTSGNARNVVNAIKVAKMQGMKTIGLTGGNGGAMKEICDVTICVPSNITPVVQEFHLPIYHTLCMMVEEVFFDK